MARIRRTADEARAHIVAVAREHVLARGPAAMRLKEVARDAGVSHPTVLHHFGSREGLVGAVVSETMAEMDTQIEQILAASTELEPGPIVGAMAKVLSEGGFGRLMAWVALSAPDGRIPSGRVQDIVATVHRTRMRLLPEGASEPAFEDSAFMSRLVTVALVGDAVMGDGLCRQMGIDADEGRADFQTRLIDLIRAWVKPTSAV